MGGLIQTQGEIAKVQRRRLSNHSLKRIGSRTNGATKFHGCTGRHEQSSRICTTLQTTKEHSLLITGLNKLEWYDVMDSLKREMDTTSHDVQRTCADESIKTMQINHERSPLTPACQSHRMDINVRGTDQTMDPLQIIESVMLKIGIIHQIMHRQAHLLSTGDMPFRKQLTEEFPLRVPAVQRPRPQGQTTDQTPPQRRRGRRRTTAEQGVQHPGGLQKGTGGPSLSTESRLPQLGRELGQQPDLRACRVERPQQGLAVDSDATMLALLKVDGAHHQLQAQKGLGLGRNLCQPIKRGVDHGH